MPTKTNKSKWILAIFTLVGAALFSFDINRSRRFENQAKAAPLVSVQTIKDCYTIIRIAELENEQSITNLIEKLPGDTINHKIADLFHRYANSTTIATNVLDQWGYELKMEWRTNVEFSGFRGEWKILTNEIIIWSVGKNGLDEGGGGDDVSLR